MEARGLSDIYTGGYGEARGRARQHDPRALREVAQQFEAYFIQQMLKSMREASLGDPIFDNQTTDTYRDILDQQLSLQMAGGRGIGLASMIEQSMRRSGVVPELAGLRPEAALGSVAPEFRAELEVMRKARPAPEPAPGRQDVAQDGVAPPRAEQASPRVEKRADADFTTPESFVARLRPFAEQAASALGVPPAVLIAQSALQHRKQ